MSSYKFLKLLIIAFSLCVLLGIGFLIYPQSMRRILTDKSEANSLDVSVFLQFVALGFSLGFFLAEKLFLYFGNRMLTSEIQGDRKELNTVLFFLTGVVWLHTGSKLLQHEKPSAIAHFLVGCVFMAYPLGAWVRGLLRKSKHRST